MLAESTTAAASERSAVGVVAELPLGLREEHVALHAVVQVPRASQVAPVELARPRGPARRPGAPCPSGRRPRRLRPTRGSREGTCCRRRRPGRTRRVATRSTTALNAASFRCSYFGVVRVLLALQRGDRLVERRRRRRTCPSTAASSPRSTRPRRLRPVPVRATRREVRAPPSRSGCRRPSGPRARRSRTPAPRAASFGNSLAARRYAAAAAEVVSGRGLLLALLERRLDDERVEAPLLRRPTRSRRRLQASRPGLDVVVVVCLVERVEHAARPRAARRASSGTSRAGSPRASRPSRRPCSRSRACPAGRAAREGRARPGRARRRARAPLRTSCRSRSRPASPSPCGRVELVRAHSPDGGERVAQRVFALRGPAAPASPSPAAPSRADAS